MRRILPGFGLAFCLVISLPIQGCSLFRQSSGTGKVSDAAVDRARIEAGLQQAVRANEERLIPIRTNAKRKDIWGAEPFLKLHAPDQQVRGTVIVFHGFAAMPVQQNPLVDYLFAEGYDVFNASVAGHYWSNVPGPAVEIAGADQLKEGGVSVLVNEFVGWPYADYGRNPVREYQDEVNLTMRIASTLRRPMHVVGLSAGATQALDIALRFPDVSRIVAYTPLLELEPGKKEKLGQAAKLIHAGRMFRREPIDGWFAWDPKNAFPLGAFWGLREYGQEVLKGAPKMAREKQLFFVTTDNEDAADTSVSQRFFEQAGGTNAGHWYWKYAREYRVPHPVNSIKERSQGMVNYYYKTLFQETLRFLNEGKIRMPRLAMQDLSADLPGFQLPERMGWNEQPFSIPAHIDLSQVQ